MVETDINSNENPLSEHEIKLLNSDHVYHLDHNYSSNNSTTHGLYTPLIIKKIINNHQPQPIKISITNKNETRQNDIYETNNNNTKNNNNNLNKLKKENENENNNKSEFENTDPIKNTVIIENNKLSNNNTSNNHIFHFKNYTPILINNQQFRLRYKDPKSGKFFNKILFESQNLTSPNGSIDEVLNDYDCNDRKMNSSRNTKRSNTINHQPPSIALFRSQSSRLTKSKTTLESRNNYFNNRNDDMTQTSFFNWKAKNERIPVQLAPDRLYINTYMEHYVNNLSNNSNKTANSNSAKINNIKFQGVSSNYSNTHKIIDNNTNLTTSQVFEQIFDMNTQFLNTYFPDMKKQKPTKLSTSSHTLPGHVALKSASNNVLNANTESKRPLKFENPSLYKPSKSSLNTSRSTHSSTIYDNDDYDVDSIEIPIILKSPNSVNSYISYLRKKNHNIFNSNKV